MTKKAPRPKEVVVSDKMQEDYHYVLTEQPGKNFAQDFQPDLTPAKMLELGVFCGVYLRDCREEFPQEWFEKASLAEDDPNCSLNYFGVNASQSLETWQEKDWIHPEDPRGWFQWYCRYYLGRRMEEEDQRQIKRWRAMKRHVAQVKNNCPQGDRTCRPKQRQALLHWAYDSRKL